MTWLPIAIATAATFGLYHVFIKAGAGKIDQVLGAVVLQVVAALVGGGLLLALWLGGRAPTATSAGLGWAAAAGAAIGVAEILAFVLYTRGAPVALAAPIVLGGSIALAAAIGLAALREPATPLQLAGVALVVVGIALVSAGRAA